jgi:ATP-dependent Zn protease
VKKLIDLAYERTTELLKNNKESLTRLASRLLEKKSSTRKTWKKFSANAPGMTSPMKSFRLTA